jgi:cation transport regulator ChaB
MPYTMANKPDIIKNIPQKAQKIWIAAFNSALQRYSQDEKIAIQTAWAAIKKAGYRKNEETGKWKRWR